MCSWGIKSVITAAHGSRTVKLRNVTPTEFWRNCIINNVYEVNTENQEPFPQSKDSLRYSRKTGSGPRSSGHTKVEEHKGNVLTAWGTTRHSIWVQTDPAPGKKIWATLGEIWERRSTVWTVNSGFTTVRLALLEKCKPQFQGCKAQGLTMPAKVSGCRRMCMCLHIHAETQRQNTPTNKWAMEWKGEFGWRLWTISFFLDYFCTFSPIWSYIKTKS